MGGGTRICITNLAHEVKCHYSLSKSAARMYFKFIAKHNEKAIYERRRPLQSAPEVILRSQWPVQQQAESSFEKPSSNRKMQPCAKGSSRKPSEQNWNAATESQDKSVQEDDRVEIATYIFNKIDLRIDGIPEKAILEDDKQTKDISEVVQKLEESKVDFGENSDQEDYMYTEEMANKNQDPGNVELVESRQTTTTIQCHACWKHISDEMIKCYCGFMVRLSPSMMEEIQERFRKLCRPQWRGVFTSRGQKCVP